MSDTLLPAILAARHVTPEMLDIISPELVPNGVRLWLPTVGGDRFPYIAVDPQLVGQITNKHPEGHPKYLSPQGRTAIPRPVERSGADTILIVEGCWDFIAAAGYAPPNVEVWGLFGCHNWVHNGVPLVELDQAQGKFVVVALDGDASDKQAVFDAGIALKDHLEKRVRANRVTFVGGLAGKAGMDELIGEAIADGTDPTAKLRQFIRGGEDKPAKRRPAKRADPVDLSGKVDVSDDQTSLLWLRDELGRNHLAGFYRREDKLVFCPLMGQEGYQGPEGNDLDGPSQVRSLSPAGLVGRITTRYPLVKASKLEVRRPLFPKGVAEAMLATLDEAPWLRTLRGVTHTPIVRADGTVLNTPGYDAASEYLYLPTLPVPAVPERPDAGQVATATAIVRNLVRGFPWVGAHDEANYLGMLLTPVLRLLTPPPYKLGVITARQPGSGKSLLARILRDVHGGVFRSEMPGDDVELGKSITGILEGTTAPVVQFDNVTGVVRSSRLAGLLTSATYSDRVLGTSNSTTMINDRLWVITGNNAALGGDLERRSLWATIDPGMPNPETRRFDLDIPAFLANDANRGMVIWALLVWVAHWHASGGEYEQRTSDDYGRWSGVVRAILAGAGVPGEFDHRESKPMASVSSDDVEWGELLAVLHEIQGERPWTVKSLLDLGDAPTQSDRDRVRTIADALPEQLAVALGKHPMANLKGPVCIAKSFGKWLMNRNGRWADGFTVRNEGKNRYGTWWKVYTS